MRGFVVILATILALAGCDVARTSFPTDPQAATAQSGGAFTVVPLTAQNVASLNQPAPTRGRASNPPKAGAQAYRLGAGDVVDIQVWDHPDLKPTERSTAAQAGFRLQADGTFYYPPVGAIQGAGRTAEQVRLEIARALSATLTDPQVDLRVTGYNSQAVAVTGAVGAPNRQMLTDVPMTLLEAIQAAGGLSDEADAGAIRLQRGGASHGINLRAFLDGGAVAQNPILRGGDVVVVPKRKAAQAYLLGQLVKPATLDLSEGPVNLTQAVTQMGGLREDQADARGIFVFRYGATGLQVYQLNASSPVAYLVGTRFTLHPEDVVYVTASPLHRWNRVISNLLPTLTSLHSGGVME